LTERDYPRRLRWQRRFLFALVTVLVVLIMFPFFWMLTMSFKTDADIFAWPPRLLFEPTIGNYVALWDGNFPRSFANSALASGVSTLLAMVIGTPGAYALSRTAMRSEKSVSLLILSSRMAPPIAFTIPYFLVYRHLGLIDTVTGLVIIYLTFNLSLVIWLMRSFFDATPRSLEEAAWIDGAGLWQGFWRIVLPLSGPGLAATAILCFLYSWNDFFFALILTRTEALTAPVAVVNFMNDEAGSGARSPPAAPWSCCRCCSSRSWCAGSSCTA
jgi:multiple sugar transport system permease protein